MEIDIEDLSIEELSRLVAEAAREEQMSRFRRVTAAAKADGSLVTEADLAVQHRLERELRARRPTIPLLGEEMEPARQRALLAEPGAGLWVLDPLDGTTNFAAGIPYFALSLALVDRKGPRLAVIHDPVRGETFAARRGGGATLDGEPLHTPPGPARIGACVAEIDLKRLPAPLAARIAAEHPFASQRQMGSAALDGCWLAAGRFHLYLHGGQSLWDYAAATLILAEAGGAATTLEGEEVYRAELVKRSVVGALNREMLQRWLGRLREG